MADKVKVPTLNLNKASTALDASVSQASTVLATDAEGS
jgi:hypothetical protein